jgi:integrase
LAKRRSLPRVSFHALRHTHASILISDGLSVAAISRRLGHKNPAVTLNIYAHVSDKKDKEVIHDNETGTF